jgi:hypothetical protein
MTKCMLVICRNNIITSAEKYIFFSLSAKCLNKAVTLAVFLVILCIINARHNNLSKGFDVT